MTKSTYPKAEKYPDLETIYSQCSGPGGLKLAEFLAEKINLVPGKRVLDVGMNRGYQSCFLAKEYGINLVGIDPWTDRKDNRPHVDHLTENAISWGVEDLVLGLQVGVPDTRFASSSFDYVYSTTALEMIRGTKGEDAYRDSTKEIHRVLRPDGLFALGEPMHLDVEPAPLILDLIQQGEEDWTKFFVTIGETVSVIQSVGFEIIESGYVTDAHSWWLEYATYDPYCRNDPNGEAKTIKMDAGSWLSFGYVIARKK